MAPIAIGTTVLGWVLGNAQRSVGARRFVRSRHAPDLLAVVVDGTGLLHPEPFCDTSRRDVVDSDGR